MQPLPFLGGGGAQKTTDKEMGEGVIIAAKSNNNKYIMGNLFIKGTHHYLGH